MNDLIVSLSTGLSLAVAGVIIVVLAYRGQRGTLPRNLWAGLRTKALLESDEAWNTGHRAAAGYLYVAGAGLIVSAVAAMFLTETALIITSLLGCVWVLAWVTIASRAADRAAAQE